MRKIKVENIDLATCGGRLCAILVDEYKALTKAAAILRTTASYLGTRTRNEKSVTRDFLNEEIYPEITRWQILRRCRAYAEHGREFERLLDDPSNVNLRNRNEHPDRRGGTNDSADAAKPALTWEIREMLIELLEAFARQSVPSLMLMAEETLVEDIRAGKKNIDTDWLNAASIFGKRTRWQTLTGRAEKPQLYAAMKVGEHYFGDDEFRGADPAAFAENAKMLSEIRQRWRAALAETITAQRKEAGNSVAAILKNVPSGSILRLQLEEVEKKKSLPAHAYVWVAKAICGYYGLATRFEAKAAKDTTPLSLKRNAYNIYRRLRVLAPPVRAMARDQKRPHRLAA